MNQSAVEDASDTAVASGDYLLFFSDIEGSTRLLERAGDQYAGMLHRHRQIISDLITLSNGRVIGTEGDSFFAAFEVADDGLRAAVSIQRALEVEPWPYREGLRVRIGLHFGSVRSMHGDLTGLDVHRAARIAASGHGGQILLSREAVEALTDGAQDALDVRLGDLGRHRLKDLRFPENLFEVKDRQRPMAFPPVRSRAHRVTNLGEETKPLLGRDHEIAEIVGLLRSHPGRLVTLLGPAGVGKSTLAEAVARTVMPDFDDGVFLVELSTTTDASLTLVKIADVLGIRDALSRPLEQDIAAMIGTGRVLLVLDTFEHLLSSAAALSRLLAACPGLRILVASQATLDIGAERAVAIEPLDLAGGVQSPAVALFMARVKEFDPTFEADAESQDAILGIVRRLEGIPLGLEIAAAQLKFLSPTQLLERLATNTGSLKGRRREVERHRSLHEAIGWSERLLSPEEREVFHGLAVFAGGFTVDDAEKVLSNVTTGDLDMLDAVATLASRSLLRRRKVNGEPRFEMFDLVRQYALNQLDASGKEERVSASYSRHYVDATTAHGAWSLHKNQKRHVIWLNTEADNIRNVLRQAIEAADLGAVAKLIEALYWYWLSRGHFNEARGWLDRIVPLFAGSANKEALGRIHVAAAYLKALGGDYAAAYDHGSAAEDIFVGLGDTHRAAVAKLIHAVGAVATERISDPMPMISSAIEVLEGQGDHFFVGLGLTISGELARLGGVPDAAMDVCQEARERFARIDNSFWLGAVNANIGHLLMGRGEIGPARHAFAEALAIGQEHDYPVVVCVAVSGLGAVAAQHGDPALGLRLLSASAQMMKRIGASFEPTDQADIDGYVHAATQALDTEAALRINSEAARSDWSETLAVAQSVAGRI